MEGKTFCDIFTGTTVVAKYFKRLGFNIIANDIMTYSYIGKLVRLRSLRLQEKGLSLVEGETVLAL